MTRILSGVVCVLAAGVIATAESPQESGAAEVGATVRRLATPPIPLRSYRAFRTLEATTRGGAMHASLTAWTSLDVDGAFHYQVTQEEGSGVIRGRVLKAALEAEREATDEASRGAITEANYRFAALPPAPDGTTRIAMSPLRKEGLLLEGALFISPVTNEMLRVEGRLVKRPSFWTRSVDVIRHYEVIQGVRVPVHMSSVASVRVVGASTFDMTYAYESINGVAIAPEPVD